ncbi:PilZ domain-containing protein [uncultured Devosia sp.]|uniref:PilZ domain-containing protein n=1 Tax=uncultured Devosia sp. TaxID=211434 RepID=UPI0035C94702
MSKLARRLDVRFIGAVPGRYALSDRPKTGDQGGVDVYACRLCSISTQSAVVVAPVRPEPGETVAAHFDHFGIIRAKATRQLPTGFAMDLELDDAGRVRLAAQIKWKKRRAKSQEPDKREHQRLQPRDPYTVLTLADGTNVPCFVIDISQSGAAVSASVLPGRGTPVAVGAMVGRVVRRLDVGFAVQFTQVHELSRLDRLLARPAEARKTPG